MANFSSGGVWRHFFNRGSREAGESTRSELHPYLLSNRMPKGLFFFRVTSVMALRTCDSLASAARKRRPSKSLVKLALRSCSIKNNRSEDGLELVIGDNTTIMKSPRNFDIDMPEKLTLIPLKYCQ